jgi:hypothetical protein
MGILLVRLKTKCRMKTNYKSLFKQRKLVMVCQIEILVFEIYFHIKDLKDSIFNIKYNNIINLIFLLNLL